MNNNDNGKRSLEGLKIFPYVAWTLTIGFALFVYHITMQLQMVANDLQTQADTLQALSEQDGSQADFDTY